MHLVFSEYVGNVFECFLVPTNTTKVNPYLVVFNSIGSISNGNFADIEKVV